MKSLSNFTLAVFIIIIFLFQCSIPSFASDQKIALFPFTINSEKNMSFLEKGVSEMLSAKFSAAKHTIIKIDEKNISNKDDILKIAKEQNVDYAISGSLMLFGNTINVSALLYEVNTGSSLVAFNKSDNNKDSLFSHIDTFAGEVLNKLEVPEPQVQPEPEKVEVLKSPPVKKDSDTMDILSTPVFKSESVEGSVNSLTTGDVNGDGIRDIIYVNGTDIFVADYKDGKYELQKKIEGKHYLKNLSVSVIDTNMNGIAEIFITSIHRTSKFVQSYVFEWNGSDYVETLPKSKWFFETMILAESGENTLIGQGQHFAEGIFSKGAHKLIYDKSENDFISGGRLDLPDGTNIYSLTSGDAMNKGARNNVSLSNNGYITVFDTQHNELWKSSEAYGGSLKYLEPRKNDSQRRLYFSPRIVASDIDKDAATEIVTISNDNSSPRALINLKNFKKGHITCLIWDRLNFESKWKTQTVSGYISDFNISDIDNDGKNDLIYSVVEKTGTFWTKKQTYFVIQPVH